MTVSWAQASALDRPDFRQVISQAKASVFPALVFIKCVQESHESGKKQAQENAASGVLIDPRGQLLTNWHVVDKAIEVRCLLHDGRAFSATVLGKDRDLDLALLALDRPADAEPLPYAALGDSSKLQEGDFVMAMGAPWGLSRSVSIGIVSCANRFLPESSEYSLWLQTDASISPGNSGGPLVDTNGRVVGLNTLGAMMGGDMGFAIPADVIRQVLPRLREHGGTNWSWTGLRLQPIRDFHRNVYFEGAHGVIVAGTDVQSPASDAGIRQHDRIVSINGRPVTAMTEQDLPAIRRTLGLLPLGKPASIEVQRDARTIKVDLTPRQKGRVEGEEFDCPRWDMTVKAINQFDNPQLHFYRKSGAFIFGIEYPGNAAGAGLAANDILVKIGDAPIKALGDVRAVYGRAMDQIDRRHRLTITVLRNGLMRQIILDFGRDFDRE